jgi:glycosyltransferase involved in cell wall biosynthesis
MPGQLPSISIVTPSYQHGQYVERTIQSVLTQDYPNLQYLVVDGGSTDKTVEILKRYDSKLSWTSEPDRGQSDAIAKGFARSRGEILGWLNSDDAYAAGALKSVGEIFAQDPDIGVVYGNADFIDADDRFIADCAHIEPFSRHRLLHYCDYIVQPAAFFRRSAFEAAGGLDCSLHWAMDYDLWLKLAAQTRFYYLPRLLAHYRWLGESKTSAGGAARLEEVRGVVRRHGRRTLPAYFRLEEVRMHLALAFENGSPASIAAHLGAAAAAVLSSPRAMVSLLSRQTWRTIRTGQLLRNSARRSAAT